MTKTPSLSNEQFDWVMSHGRFSTKVSDFLRLVVVRGEQPILASKKMGMGRSRPYSAITQFWNLYEKTLKNNNLKAVIVFESAK